MKKELTPIKKLNGQRVIDILRDCGEAQLPNSPEDKIYSFEDLQLFLGKAVQGKNFVIKRKEEMIITLQGKLACQDSRDKLIRELMVIKDNVECLSSSSLLKEHQKASLKKLITGFYKAMNTEENHGMVKESNRKNPKLIH